MKKILVILLAFVMLVSVVSCGKSAESAKDNEAAVESNDNDAAAESQDNVAGGGEDQQDENDGAQSETFNGADVPEPTPSGSVRAEVKEAADAYEKIVDEYCEFMKTFDANDTSRLNEYLEFVEKLSEQAEALNGLDELELNEDEVAYLSEVDSRCQKKLEEAGLN